MSSWAGDTARLGPESRLRPEGVQASVCSLRAGTCGPVPPCLAPGGPTGCELTDSARQGAASGRASAGERSPPQTYSPWCSKLMRPCPQPAAVTGCACVAIPVENLAKELGISRVWTKPTPPWSVRSLTHSHACPDTRPARVRPSTRVRTHTCRSAAGAGRPPGAGDTRERTDTAPRSAELTWLSSDPSVEGTTSRPQWAGGF